MPEYLIPCAMVSLFAGTILYKIIKNKGIRGALFGAEVINSSDAIEGRSDGLVSSKVRVHVLKQNQATDASIGIEVVNKSFASYRLTALALGRQEALQLVGALEEAIRKSQCSD